MANFIITMNNILTSIIASERKSGVEEEYTAANTQCNAITIAMNMFMTCHVFLIQIFMLKMENKQMGYGMMSVLKQQMDAIIHVSGEDAAEILVVLHLIVKTTSLVITVSLSQVKMEKIEKFTNNVMEMVKSNKNHIVAG